MTWTAEKAKTYQREYYLRRKKEVAHICVQLSHDERNLIIQVAKRDGVTLSDKVRDYITWGLDLEADGG